MEKEREQCAAHDLRSKYEGVIERIGEVVGKVERKVRSMFMGAVNGRRDRGNPFVDGLTK